APGSSSPAPGTSAFAVPAANPSRVAITMLSPRTSPTARPPRNASPLPTGYDPRIGGGTSRVKPDADTTTAPLLPSHTMAASAPASRRRSAAVSADPGSVTVRPVDSLASSALTFTTVGRAERTGASAGP